MSKGEPVTYSLLASVVAYQLIKGKGSPWKLSRGPNHNHGRPLEEEKQSSNIVQCSLTVSKV